MKVAFDYSIFSLQQFGGISRYIIKLANEINSESSVEAKVFAPLYVNQYISDLDSGICNGKKIPFIPPKTGRIFDALNCLTSSVSIHKFKPDILHHTYFPRLPPMIRSVPKVVTVHDMIHEKFSTSFGFMDRTIQLKKKAIDTADHVICVSEATKNDLLEIYNIDKASVSVVHHGWEEPPKAENSLEKYSFERPFLLYVGNRNGYKNFSNFIKDYSNDHELKYNFDVIAFGGGKFTKYEKKMFYDYKIDSDNIHQVSGDDALLSMLYRKASVFVYPSLYEGFGLPLLEAMSNSCPIVAHKVSSIPEVAGLAAEYIESNQPDEIAAAVKRVIFVKERRDELLHLGKQQLKKFSWSKCASETLRIYRNLIY